MPPNEASVTAVYRQEEDQNGQNGLAAARVTKVAPVPINQIRVEDKLYSTEKLAEMHPGGPIFIRAFSGRDASQAFISYHRRTFPHSRAKSALEGTDSTVDYTTDDHADYMELCERVNKVVPRLKSFAPWYYYIKVAFLLGAFTSLEVYCHYNSFYPLHLMVTVGFLAALIGLNIQHDANHGSVSRNPNVNWLLGLSENWIGGSQINWIHQHVVQHHLHTNDVHLDPDMASTSYVRMNPLDPLKKVLLGQHIYFWILLPIYGVWVVIQTIDNLIRGAHHTPMSPLVKGERMFDICSSALFLFRWVVLPVVRTGSFSTLFSTLTAMMVCGYYLAFFFMISHNYEGVFAQKDTTRPSNKGCEENSWLYKQVVTSSNVAGWWLCQLNGGLNYQIEHHLFPRVNHCHYPTIAPVVRQFCEEKGIPYNHFDTVWENWVSSATHLFQMGRDESPKNMKLK